MTTLFSLEESLEALIQKKGIPKSQIEQAKRKSSSFEDLPKQLLVMGLISEEEIAALHAKKLGMQTIDLIDVENLPSDLIKKLPYTLIKNQLCLPIREENGFVIVAIGDPFELKGLEEIRFLLKKPIRSVLAPRSILIEAINHCFKEDEGSATKIASDLNDEASPSLSTDEESGYDLLEEKGDSPIIKLLNLILTDAIQQGASDIHFEPNAENFKVRFRIDGVLQSRHTLSKQLEPQLITRIKVLAKLDIAEHRLPQDGRSKLMMGGKEIDFRVSTIPISDGERIVLRILDKGNIQLGLDHIGISPETLQEFKNMIHCPEGIILVTGPTGSGKTTTLYSAISDLDAGTINIMTIEDPVEYKLPKVAQINVKPKINLTFATGLRHILRQDPDVILIGEIRDQETAQIAVQASLTGHLVLSTLHTNDAPSAIARLADMGIEPYLLSSSIIGILAQRLVRKLCPHCKAKTHPTPLEVKNLNLDPEKPIYKPVGCSQCYETGYRGRAGIYELMTVKSRLKKEIAHSQDASQLKKVAQEEGMKSLQMHGKELIELGITSVPEVLRVSLRLE